MAIHLVFDTNVLRQEHLVSRNMQLLARLAKSGEVAVFVPSIVRGEFQSQRTLEIRDQAGEAEKALLAIGRQLEAQGEVHVSLSKLIEELRATARQAELAVPVEFDLWMAGLGAVVLSFEPPSIAEVLDEYFSGRGAFRKAKHRDDFPDAIASHEIRALLGTTDRVHIACRDITFKNHLRVERRYTIVDGLDQFFELKEVKDVQARLDAQDRHVAELVVLFSSDDFRKSLTAYLEKAGDLLESVYVESEHLEGLEVLGLDTWGESLNFASASSISGVDYGEVTFIDEGHFSLEVEVRTEAQIHYACMYGPDADVAVDRGAEMWSMDGDGAADMKELREVSLMGHVELQFDPAFDSREVEVHAQYLQVTPPKIRIDLEIRRATVY